MSNVTLVQPDRSVTLREGNRTPVQVLNRQSTVTVQRGGRIVAPRITVNVNIDGGNSTLDVGGKGEVTFPFRVHVDKYVVMSPQLGSFTVSLRQTNSLATDPPTALDEVATFTMNGVKKQEGPLNLIMEANDVLGIALTATALVERISLTLFGDRL